jgi:uncharacterized circularly permuted ATP-grasp superfamily protein
MTARFSILVFLALCAPIAFGAGRENVEQKLQQQGAEAAKNAGLYYDEIFDQNGKLRPQYRDIYPRILERSRTDLRAVRRLTQKDFRGDNALSPVARILTTEENELLKTGTAQRGRALQEFLKDYYSGKKSYDKAGIISDELVSSIVARAGESGFYGQLKPELIKFMYGPDIIRDSKGAFRVLEDNTNYLGLQGDLVKARESLWQRMPEYAKALESEKLADPGIFYRELLANYRKEMKNPGEKIIFFSVPPYPDNEDRRLNKIWSSLGVEQVTPFSRKKLVKKDGGMYLEWKDGKKFRSEKVGFMIFNAEFACLDSTFRPAWEQCLSQDAKYWLAQKSSSERLGKNARAQLEEALRPDGETGKVNYKKLEETLGELGHSPSERQVPGLLEAITKGQLLTNNTPGTEFINDKEFNTNVEKLIRFYLKEEPILKNIRTDRLYQVNAAGKREINPEVFQRLQQDMDHQVVKVVDGRGGEGVWVGPKLTDKERANLLDQLATQTEREVIVQEFVHPSVLAGDIVDIRMLAQVGAEEKAGNGASIVVSEVGATRAVTKEGDGKVNLSGGKAHEVTVLVRETKPPSGRPKTCAELFAR